jgi:8-oxo-dGTP diphosphatase
LAGQYCAVIEELTGLKTLRDTQAGDKMERKGISAMHAKFPVTVHMLFLRENQILLIRRFQTGYMDGHYSLPAGHLDGGEAVRRAAVREAREEVGVRIDPADLRFAGVFHRFEGDERVDFFVHVQAWQGEPVNAEPEKCDDLRWAELEALPENTIPYIRRAIENFQAGVLFEEFGWEK